MRVTQPWLAIVFALGGCGDDQASGPTACDVGPEILSEALATLDQSEPRCSSDDDCVNAITGVRCPGFSSGACPTAMHRKTAAAWDPKAVCEKIEHASVPSNIACEILPSCAALEAPTCEAGSCVSVHARFK